MLNNQESQALTEAVRLGGLQSNPSLSKFSPLSEIVYFDDFDTGLNGWTELIGNYEERLENVKPAGPGRTDDLTIVDCRPPMLSSATMHDTGTAGSMDGTYSMKIATRAERGHLAKSLKRATFQKKALLQCECYFTFHPEASELVLGDRDVRAVGVGYDIQDDTRRYWPAIRFVNAEDGERLEKWQIHAHGDRLPHLDGWQDVEDGHQELCYNEIATKQNWHYLRWVIDLETQEYRELQCNDMVWDLSGQCHTPIEAYSNLRNLLNLGFWVEADVDKRAFLYVDSVVLSTEKDSK